MLPKRAGRRGERPEARPQLHDDGHARGVRERGGGAGGVRAPLLSLRDADGRCHRARPLGPRLVRDGTVLRRPPGVAAGPRPADGRPGLLQADARDEPLLRD